MEENIVDLLEELCVVLWGTDEEVDEINANLKEYN